MKNQKPFGILLYASFFLCMGIMWVCLIYQRNNIIMPVEMKPYFQKQGVGTVDYVELKNEMEVTLKYVSAKAPVVTISMFYMWSVVVLEVVCGFMYIFAGIALFRRYSLSPKVSVIAVVLDVLFKTMVVVAFYRPNLLDLNMLVSKKKLVFFFLPEHLWIKEFSGFFSGIKFFEPDGLLTLLAFLGYVLTAIVFFNQKQIRAYFQEKEQG